MISQGILLGLTLSLMVGPLLFAIVEAGLEGGFRSGMAVAVGVWLSDLMYVVLVWHSLEILQAVTAFPDFSWWAGLVGGGLLMAFGLGSFFKKSPSVTTCVAPRAAFQTWGTYLLRGFLINTVNPFTVFFWVGIGGGVVAPSQWSNAQMFRFFSAMLLTLCLADTLKAYAAKRVREWLTPEHIRWVKRGIGLILLVFGLVLMVRVWQ